MSKSILYAVNNASQTISTNVNFGAVVRRYGNNCQLSGGNATIDGAGYYDIDVNLTLIADATGGTAVVTLYGNGTAIPGATLTQTMAASSSYAVTLPCMVRTFCCAPVTITVGVTGVEGTISNAAIVVEKE